MAAAFIANSGKCVSAYSMHKDLQSVGDHGKKRFHKCTTGVQEVARLGSANVAETTAAGRELVSRATDNFKESKDDVRETMLQAKQQSSAVNCEVRETISEAAKSVAQVDDEIRSTIFIAEDEMTKVNLAVQKTLGQAVQHVQEVNTNVQQTISGTADAVNEVGHQLFDLIFCQWMTDVIEFLFEVGLTYFLVILTRCLLEHCFSSFQLQLEWPQTLALPGAALFVNRYNEHMYTIWGYAILFLVITGPVRMLLLGLLCLMWNHWVISGAFVKTLNIVFIYSPDINISELIRDAHIQAVSFILIYLNHEKANITNKSI